MGNHVVDYMPDSLSGLDHGFVTTKTLVVGPVRFFFRVEHSVANSVLFEGDRVERYLTALVRLLRRSSNDGRNGVRVRVIENQNRKCLPESRMAPITPSNVNSGYTDFSEERSYDIVIYRCEEFLKVLCHELLHFWDDTSGTTMDAAVDRITMDALDLAYCEGFGMRPDRVRLSIYESITELRATCLNAIICTDGSSDDEVRSALTKEYAHSRMVCRKLAWHFKGELKKWSETTHAFSYYVVKMWLLGLLLKKRSYGYIHFPKKYAPSKDCGIRMTTLEFK